MTGTPFFPDSLAVLQNRIGTHCSGHARINCYLLADSTAHFLQAAPTPSGKAGPDSSQAAAAGVATQSSVESIQAADTAAAAADSMRSVTTLQHAGSEEGSGGVLPMEVDDDAMFQKKQVKVGKADMGQVAIPSSNQTKYIPVSLGLIGVHTCLAMLAPHIAHPRPLVFLWSMQHMPCRRGLLCLAYNNQASPHNMLDASSLRVNPSLSLFVAYTMLV